MAAPQRVLGVMLPCYSHPQDEDDARLVATAFSIPVARVDLGPTFDALTESLHARHQGPADARRRPRHQAAVARRQRQAAAADGVALLHRQLAELSRGRHRQSERDHARLLHEVRRRRRGCAPDRRPAEERSARAGARARRAGAVIDKPPTAGLWVGQTDEDEMGFSYDTLERTWHGRRPSRRPSPRASPSCAAAPITSGRCRRSGNRSCVVSAMAAMRQ